MSNRKTNRIASSDKMILCAPKDNGMVLSYTLNVFLKFIKVTIACTAGMLVCAYPIKMMVSSFNNAFVLGGLFILFFYIGFCVADRPFKYFHKIADRVYLYKVSRHSWKYFFYRGSDGGYGLGAMMCATLLCFGIMNVANNDSQVTDDSTYAPLLLALCVTVFILCLVFLNTYRIFYKWKKRLPRSTVKIGKVKQKRQM